MTPADLTARRRSLGLTQAELAALLGVHPQTVRAWERGRQRVPAMVALALETLEREHGAIVVR